MTLLENNTLLEISISLFIHKKIKRMNYNYYGTNNMISGLLLFKYNKILKGGDKKVEIQGARQQLFLPNSLLGKKFIYHLVAIAGESLSIQKRGP